MGTNLPVKVVNFIPEIGLSQSAPLKKSMYLVAWLFSFSCTKVTYTSARMYFAISLCQFTSPTSEVLILLWFEVVCILMPQCRHFISAVLKWRWGCIYEKQCINNNSDNKQLLDCEELAVVYRWSTSLLLYWSHKTPFYLHFHHGNEKLSAQRNLKIVESYSG